MDTEYTADSIANRDLPIPIIGLQGSDDASSDEGTAPGRRGGDAKLSAATDRASDALSASDVESASVASPVVSPHRRSQSLQDRLFAKWVRPPLCG